MANNFYGSCKGSSSSKYDLWLNVTQNSQNIDSNLSNITVKLYLKRNDGYSDSAYNLYEEQNTAKITVGGNVVVSKNLKIDTRNSATVLLANWTGNVTHGNDGKLQLSVSGEFTMSNSTLSSGSASGVFNCTAIPRKSSLSFSSTTINPGSSVIATVTPTVASFSHRILWRLGSYSSSITMTSGVLSAEISVPDQWLYGLNNTSKGTVNVSVETYNGSTKIGANTYKLTLVVPATDKYKPEFSIGLTKVDNGVPSDWNEYVQGISKVTVNPDGLNFKFGASLAAVTITVGSVSIRQLPATFNLSEAGELVVTVAVRDTRGLLTVKTTTIKVNSYTPPSVEITELFRCDSEGNESAYGENLFVRYKLNYSSVNSKNKAQLSVQYKTPNDSQYSASEAITTNPCVFGSDKISMNASSFVRFTITDRITKTGVQIVRTVSAGHIPFNIRRGGKGAAFGKFSEKDNELSVGWNLNVDGNVEIKGEMNWENVACTCNTNTQDLLGYVKYYPCIKSCIVRLRVKTSQLLNAGTTHIIAHIPDKPPAMFMPLSCIANYESGGVSVSGVVYKTGDVIFRSSVDVPEGTYIYISGIYVADYDEYFLGN